MAIAKIKKIEIVGLQSYKEEFLKTLQNIGSLELISDEEGLSAVEPLAGTASDIMEIEEALAYLMTFEEKTSFFKGMVNIKTVVRESELKETISDFDYRSLLQNLSAMRSRLKDITLEIERLEQEKRLLIPWRRLDVELNRLYATSRCESSLGVSSTADYRKIVDEFLKNGIEIFMDAVDQDRTNTYLVLVYIKEDLERIESVLKNYRFNFVMLGRHPYTVNERLDAIALKIKRLDGEARDIRMKIAALLKNRFGLMVLHDHLANIKMRQEINQTLPAQRYTFVARGWVKSRDAALLEKSLHRHFKDMAVFVSEPRPDEEVPVDLENNRLLQPFEFITKIYGFPKYSEVDPTPYLAPFFFLYFGFCVSDVGYGLILALISLYALKRYRMGPTGLRFFRLFLYCGISTIIIGALTGSWFGNLVDLLANQGTIFAAFKNFKDSIIMLDPMKEPTKLLAIALSFGIIQVWFGNIVAAIGNLKNRRYLAILFDQATMLTLLFGLTGLGLVFLKLVSPVHLHIFKLTALVGAVGLILTQGRSEKGMGAKLFFGAYNLYSSLSGYLSDILSYSRLWALGLVTGVMASTINLIGIQFGQIFSSLVPFIDKVPFLRLAVSALIMLLIFTFGHSISFFMNLLGAFVHPVRLQFVEFFSKFFKSSGRPFRPFRAQTKYINIV